MTHQRDDVVWEVAVTPLGTSPAPDGVVEIRVSAAVRRWVDELAPDARASTAAEWRTLGDGRYALALHLGPVDVDAVLERDGDAFTGRARARTHEREPDAASDD